MSETSETCPVDIWDGWHSHPCRRPIKRNGKCGLHAAADERRERNEADRKAKARERDRLAEVKAERQATLLAAEAAVERVRALLDGAPMVSQAEVRRALATPTTNPQQPRLRERQEDV